VLGANALRHLDITSHRWLLVAALLYVIGVWVVTGACNIPRNTMLDSLDPAAPGSVAMWRAYVREWTAWNHVRTVASLASFVALIQALRFDQA
jgi:uncharacterized membrane protein